MQASKAKRLTFLFLVFSLLIAGCNTDQAPMSFDSGAATDLDKADDEWNPHEQHEGPLSVKVDPESAKVTTKALPEENGVIRVKMKVEHFGYENGRPRPQNSQYLDITLTRPNFVSQRYHMMAPRREATATLLRMSYEKSKRRNSFKRASELYRAPMAYPTYIPAEFTLRETITSGRGISILWVNDDEHIRMSFMPKRARAGILNTPPSGTPSTVMIDKSLEATLYDYGDKIFLSTEGRASWNINMEISGLTQRETSQVLDGMRLLD